MKQIDFYGDKLDVVDMEDGKAGIVVRRLVENLGLDWGSQTRKLENPLFNCCVNTTVGADGKSREMLVLPISRVSAYLFSINVNRVREDLREKLALYQIECADVLYNYWSKGYAVNPRPTTEGILTDYVSGVGAVHTHFLNNLLDNYARTPEHHNAMQQVVYSILTEALMAEDLDLNNNLVKRKAGWQALDRVELTVLQTVESEIGLYFAKHGVPDSVPGTMKMAESVGKSTTRRLYKAVSASENFSEQFEERISDLLGVK